MPKNYDPARMQMKEETLDGVFNLTNNVRRSLRELAAEAEEKKMSLACYHLRFQSICTRAFGALESLTQTESDGIAAYDRMTAEEE